MMKTDKNNLADIDFELQWKSSNGMHIESYFAKRANVWRDFFSPALIEALMNRSVGETVEVSFKAGEIIPDRDPRKVFRVKHSQFDTQFRPDTVIHPRRGRFYPKGILKGVANVFRINKEPFRCAEVDDSSILVDFNHPLAGTELLVRATISKIETKTAQRGGTSNDWMESLTTGTGMQIRWNGQPTDFFSDNPFARPDVASDRHFYEKPRFVNHIDEKAIETISDLYGKVLHDGNHVLDLMSSWNSHIPPHVQLGKLTGLGMNIDELKKNEQLTGILVHDLNEEPVLPFENQFFDAVICTVSVEYLTNPVRIFKEVGRILKPGGCFINTFSNRWFPPKVTTIWEQLYEFERMGLISEYFLLSEQFENLSTHSLRGQPRPEDDKYYGELFVSDPVYGVWAYKR
ncbi:MAG: methyltransferase domain-containing protein [Syntrophobacteraceae bacterium]